MMTKKFIVTVHCKGAKEYPKEENKLLTRSKTVSSWKWGSCWNAIVEKLCFGNGKKRMNCLQSFNTRWTNFLIIFLCMGILSTGIGFASQKHEGCQDSQCARGDENVITMKSSSYEELLKKQCEHNVPVIECDGCRHEVGAVKIDKSVIGEIITIRGAESSDIGIMLKATGEVGPDQNRFVVISPRMPGVAKEVFVDWGDRVKKGQILVILDSIELGQARADYKKAKAMLKLAKKNYQREKSLYRQNICSKKQFLEAETAYKQAQIELKSLRERLKLMGLHEDSMLNVPEGNVYSLFTIAAPFDGTVIEKKVTVGELKDAFSPIVTISDLTRIWVWFDVYEKDITKVKVGNRVAISVASYPEEQFDGLVTYIGVTVNEKTRTVKVRAEVDNCHEKLKPGMFAKVLLQMETGGDSLMLPAEAVQTDGQQHFVFVSLNEGYFLRRYVTPGARVDGHIKVVSGLDRGDRVVVRGSFLLKSEIMKEKFGEGCAH